MFSFRSSHRPPGPTLNAITPIDDDAERRARHLRQCARLAEIGMELVEAAQQEALDDVKFHPDRRICRHTGMPEPLEGRSTVFAELFCVLSRCVRQAILLEARIAAGTSGQLAPQNQTRLQPQAPEAHLAHTAHGAPTTVTANRLPTEPVEDDLAADAARSAEDILAGIRNTFASAMDAGLAPSRAQTQPTTPPLERPPERPHERPPERPRRPPPPLTQAERSRLAYLQHNPPPTNHPARKTPPRTGKPPPD